MNILIENGWDRTLWQHMVENSQSSIKDHDKGQTLMKLAWRWQDVDMHCRYAKLYLGTLLYL